MLTRLKHAFEVDASPLLQKRLHRDKPTPLHDSGVGNEASASKQRKPIVEPEPYKPPSGKYSGGLESLDEVISAFYFVV